MLNVGPAPTAHNLANLPLGNAKRRRQRILSFPQTSATPYFAYLVICEDRHRVGGTSKARSASFSVSISRIVEVGSKPKMSGVHARRDIAPVADYFALRHVALIGDHPHEPTRDHRMSLNAGLPISALDGQSPQPASSDRVVFDARQEIVHRRRLPAWHGALLFSRFASGPVGVGSAAGLRPFSHGQSLPSNRRSEHG